MTTWLALAAAVALVPFGVGRRPGSRRAASGSLPPLNVVGAVAAGIAPLVTLPLPWSPIVAAVGAAAAWRWLPTAYSTGEHDVALALAQGLPGAVDLLSAVLRIGLSDVAALTLVAGAVDEPLRGHLLVVARHRELGATPDRAWRSVAGVGMLDDLAGAMTRHAESGTPVAAVLERVAADARRQFHTQSQEAARAAAVRAVIPLAACFLPAFIAVGVIPIVASLMSDLSF